MIPSPGDILSAYARIKRYVRRTPVIRIDAADFGVTLDTPLTLKLEFLQHSGSFKPRGAFNNLLSRKVPAAGVAAASGGNYGADARVGGARYADALERCEAFVRQSGALSVHAYDAPETVAGQGSVGLEW